MNTSISSNLFSFPSFSYAECKTAAYYTGKAAFISRNLLNAAVHNPTIRGMMSETLHSRVKTITSRLKLFVIVNVPFSLVTLAEKTNKVYHDLKRWNFPGVALETLSVSIITADIFDSVTTFVNAVLGLANMEKVAFFTRIGTPLGFFISGASILLNIIQLAKSSLQYNRLNNESNLEPDVASKERNLIQTKITVQCLDIASNMAYIQAMLLLSATTGGSAPFLFLSCGALIKLGTTLYVESKKNIL